MNDEFLVFVIADLIGAATLWLVTRAGEKRPWAWSIAVWVTVAALGLGLVPLATIMPIAAMTMVIGVGLIAPVVGLIAALMIAASPIVAGHRLWGWWRRRRAIARVSRA